MMGGHFDLDARLITILEVGNSRAGHELALGLVERILFFYGSPGGEVKVVPDSRCGSMWRISSGEN